MLRNHLKIAFRNLFKNKVFSFINLFGLTLGLTCCLLISVYVVNELSFDRYHKNSDRIVRLASKVDGASFENGIAKVGYPWGQAAKDELPEVEERCRFLPYGQVLVSKGDEKYLEEGGLFTDANVFDMFSWKLLQGNPANALTEPNSLVLNETLAKKYFPDGNAIGKTLLFDNQLQYKVTGVMADVPENSHFVFNFLVSLNTYTHPDLHDWVRWNQFYTYLLLKPDASLAQIAQKFDAILDKHLDAENAQATFPLLQPLSSIHLHSNLFRELSVNSNIIYVYIFSGVALFILLIAALNFVNLTTAQASTRAKEVGVRKTVGASRAVLIKQFMSETMLICFIAAILAMILTSISLPTLNEFLGRNLSANWLGNPILIISLAGITLVTAVLSGYYPAFILSAFQPGSAIKGQASLSGNALLRKTLVVFQFAIATFLIIAALVMTRQLDYIQNKNLGFNKEQILLLSMTNPEMRAQAETMKEELKRIPGVLSVSASANGPGGSDYGIPYQAVGKNDEELPAMRCLVIDHDFIETYGMEMAMGRGFSKEMATDTAAYLINEEAARQLGWDNPLEHQMAMPAIGRGTGQIVGVVKDFHFRSLHEKIAPVYFFINPAPNWRAQFSVKLSTNEISGTLQQMEQVWKKFEPNYPFAYEFFDEQFASLHDAEARTANVIRWFTFVAILITCFGLFGLSTYMAVQRTKEIGIRKVLGASVSSIVLLLSKDFLKLVVIGFVIAVPLAYYATNNWLQDFAYRINLNGWLFGMAGALAIVIAFITISFQSIRAAVANPVKSLRDE
ncbi:MAG: ABC transporter permease [Saprospiraceae bacterium]|nr:ABC transporter permease [Saprospiraceae bacterium]